MGYPFLSQSGVVIHITASPAFFMTEKSDTNTVLYFMWMLQGDKNLRPIHVVV